MNTPTDARLAIYLLEILAGDAVNYRNNPDYYSRAEKAWHRLTHEDCVRPGRMRGTWLVKSTRKDRGWHAVEPAALACDCEDRNLQGRNRYLVFVNGGIRRTERKPYTKPICHHIIIAALAEAGRRDAARVKREAVAEWDRVKAAGGIDEPRRWPTLREHLTKRKVAAEIEAGWPR